jgi:hypothetical protein
VLGVCPAEAELHGALGAEHSPSGARTQHTRWDALAPAGAKAGSDSEAWDPFHLVKDAAMIAASMRVHAGQGPDQPPAAK